MNPNIIILLIDALRPKNLSLFGYNKETDKFLKKISKDNILFRNHFSTSNATAPALTSILTGEYPPNHGIIHQLPYTKPEEMEKVKQIKFWLPSFLKEKGYKTFCIDWVGLWMKKDFDFYGEGDKSKLTSTNPNSPFISAKDTIDIALSLISKSTKPFFLFTHFWDTHFPFPNIPYTSKHTKEDRDKTLSSIKNEYQREYLKKRTENRELYTIKDMIEKYDLAIENIDNEIGRLYNYLIEKKLWDNTIFIVLGDHGDNLTEHEIYFSHSGLFEDSIHVPMIMHIPGFNKTEITGLTQHTDIAPTILEFLKSKIPENLDGSSIFPLIKNKAPIRDKIFAFDGLCEDISTIRTKNKKIIFARNSFCNLCKGKHHSEIEEYNLEKDPDETNNIYSEKSEMHNFLQILKSKNFKSKNL